MSLHIDLFCSVVDNYGDIGVCWRLAQQLANHAKVRLVVDDLTVFQRIQPELNPKQPSQLINQVLIVCWSQAAKLRPADYVIETFACELPTDYKTRMPDHTALWINLDYLSAESWVEDLHLQPSPQPNGVPKYFFFPGFTARTGGLMAHPRASAPIAWEKYGITKPTGPVAFVFSYPQAPLQILIEALAKQKTAWTVLLAASTPRLSTVSAHLAIYSLPYLAQSEFDAFLQHVDLNLVRGEDSFVGAIWAAKPFIWQPYQQEDDLHLQKLDAWLEHTTFSMQTKTLIKDWNSARITVEQLHIALQSVANWHHECVAYREKIKKNTDLCSQLLAFYSQKQQKRVK